MSQHPRAKIDPRALPSEDCAHPGTYTWTYGYNAADALASVRDPLTNLTQLGYDLDGYLQTRTDPNNHVIRYGYNANHNLAMSAGVAGRSWLP